MPTPHNKAQIGEIAKTVIMPGDPLRATFIAKTYLTNAKLVNDVRGMNAYTGEYKGKTITVMAHGMGIPSIGIYAYELYNFYDVERIIRVGSCGSYNKDIHVRDIILVDKAYSESTFPKTQNGFTGNIIPSSSELNDLIIKTAEEKNVRIIKSNIHCTDAFYGNANKEELIEKYGANVVEMESFGLFHLAKNVFHRQASCLLTVSDSLVTKEELTAEERQLSFNTMLELALDAAVK